MPRNAAATDIPIFPARAGTAGRHPKIDGNLGKSVWRRAVRVPLNESMFTADAPPHPLSTYCAAWDEHFLYLAYEAWSKKRPRAGSTGVVKGPPQNRRKAASLDSGDCFEFFVDLHADEHHFWELHHNARNHFQEILCIRPRGADDPLRHLLIAPGVPVVLISDAHIADDGKFGFKSAVSPLRRVKHHGKTFFGYTGELRLPLKSLGCDTARCRNGNYDLRGMRLRVFAAQLRATKDPVYVHSAKGVHHGWFHNALSHANHLRCVVV